MTFRATSNWVAPDRSNVVVESEQGFIYRRVLRLQEFQATPATRSDTSLKSVGQTRERIKGRIVDTAQSALCLSRGSCRKTSVLVALTKKTRPAVERDSHISPTGLQCSESLDNSFQCLWTIGRQGHHRSVSTMFDDGFA